MTNPIGPLGAGRRGLHPPGRRHLRQRRHQRPGLDREGLRHGRGPGRQPPARLRPRQVHQPQRHGLLRRHVPGHRADHRAGQPPPVRRPGAAHRRRADPLRGARAVADGAVPPRGQRRPAHRLRVDLRAPCCRRSSRTAPTTARCRAASPPSSCATTRSACARAGSRSTASAPRSPPTPGCRPATTRGACATTWVRPRPTWSPPSTGSTVASFQIVWSPVLMERPDGSRYGLFLNVVDIEGPGFRAAHDHRRRRARRRLRRAHRRRRVRPRLRPGEPAAEGRRPRPPPGRRHRPPAGQIEVLSDTGFHLGAGLYFGFNGHHHGEWRGELLVEGERIDDCTTGRERPAPAPDPRHRRAGHRPGRRRRRRGQLPADHHRHLAGARPDPGHVLDLTPADDEAVRCRDRA